MYVGTRQKGLRVNDRIIGVILQSLRRLPGSTRDKAKWFLEPLIDSCVLIKMKREQPTWSRWCTVIRSLPASSVDGMPAVPGDWPGGVCTVYTVCPVCSH